MDVKRIQIKGITAQSARHFIKGIHYSGKVVQNSQLNLGAFYEGRFIGAMQFGPSMNGRTGMRYVTGTKRGQYLELNRFCMVQDAPKNAESRSLAMAFKLIRKNCPNVKWIITYADGRCMGGVIYKACGFLYLGKSDESTFYTLPDNDLIHKLVFTAHALKKRPDLRGKPIAEQLELFYGQPCPPFKVLQYKYLKFMDPAWRDKLTVPVMKYEQCVKSIDADAPVSHSGEGGSNPTLTLQHSG